MNHDDFKHLKKRFDKVWQMRVNDMDTHCADIALHVLPSAIKSIKSLDKHDRSAWRKIVDRTGKGSLKIFAAGMVSATCSASRPWFTLTPLDSSLKKNIRVKQWLKAVEEATYAEFAKSNVYRVVHQAYMQLGAFGTAAALIPEKSKDHPLMHLIPLTFGEYAITTDAYNKPDGLYRKFKLTTANVVQQFGLDNASDKIKSAYNNKNLETEFVICHAVYPRQNAKGEGAINMPFASVYWEDNSTDKVLRESGFTYFPAVCPRWDISNSDVYGDSPASECLGDMNALQKGHKQIFKGIDYQVEPPLLIPEFLKGQERETLPGGISYYNPAPGDNTAQVQKMMNVDFNVNYVMQVNAESQRRIREAFHTDMFLMLDSMEKGQMTATEVAERKSEKMMVVGPEGERQNDELLRPLVEICVQRVLETNQHLQETAPSEIQEAELKIDFVSILAQAQKAGGAITLERMFNIVSNVAQINPEALDKFNVDGFLDEYADITGTPATIFNDEKTYKQIRQARAQQQAAMQQQAMMQQQADMQQKQAQALQTASQTDGDNLNEMIEGAMA